MPGPQPSLPHSQKPSLLPSPLKCASNPHPGQSSHLSMPLSSLDLAIVTVQSPEHRLYSCLCHLLRLLLCLTWIIIVVCSQSPVSRPPSLSFPAPLYCHPSTFWAQAASHFPGECKTFDSSPWPTRKFHCLWHLSFPIWVHPVWPE